MDDRGFKFGDSGSRDLVPGTLRGFRSWMIGTLSTDKVEYHEVRNFVEFQWSMLEVSISMHDRMTHMNRMEPVFATENVLKSLSQDIYWGGDTVDAEICTEDVMGALISVFGVIKNRYDHVAPVAGCTCGLYGWYTMPWAMHEHPGLVIGAVEASGKTLLGSAGFKSRRQKVVAVAPAHPSLPAIWLREHFAERYPDVEVLDDSGLLAARFKPDLGTLQNLGVELAPAPPKPSGPDRNRDLWMRHHAEDVLFGYDRFVSGYRFPGLTKLSKNPLR